jgi:leader peptidase (prepilin peptidase)/N-methyltransferase
MAILWALVGLLAGCLLNVAVHSLLRMEKDSEPLESFVVPEPRPWRCQSALLYALFGRRMGLPGCETAPGRSAWGVEAATALAFLLLFLRFGLDTRLLLASLYTCVLVIVFVVDWRRHLIYRIVVYPSTLLALFLTPLVFQMPLWAGVAGAAVGWLVFALLYGLGLLVFRKEAMGRGDVDLAMLLGAMMGFPAIMVVLLATSVIGGITAIGLLASGRSGRAYMPYGTAMCLGAFVTFFLNVPSL